MKNSSNTLGGRTDPGARGFHHLLILGLLPRAFKHVLREKLERAVRDRSSNRAHRPGAAGATPRTVAVKIGGPPPGDRRGSASRPIRRASPWNGPNATGFQPTNGLVREHPARPRTVSRTTVERPRGARNLVELQSEAARRGRVPRRGVKVETIVRARGGREQVREKRASPAAPRPIPSPTAQPSDLSQRRRIEDVAPADASGPGPDPTTADESRQSAKVRRNGRPGRRGRCRPRVVLRGRGRTSAPRSTVARQMPSSFDGPGPDRRCARCARRPATAACRRIAARAARRLRARPKGILVCHRAGMSGPERRQAGGPARRRDAWAVNGPPARARGGSARRPFGRPPKQTGSRIDPPAASSRSSSAEIALAAQEPIQRRASHDSRGILGADTAGRPPQHPGGRSNKHGQGGRAPHILEEIDTGVGPPHPWRRSTRGVGPQQSWRRSTPRVGATTHRRGRQRRRPANIVVGRAASPFRLVGADLCVRPKQHEMWRAGRRRGSARSVRKRDDTDPSSTRSSARGTSARRPAAERRTSGTEYRRRRKISTARIQIRQRVL